MKIALVPINAHIGNFEGNLKQHKLAVEQAAKLGAALVVFPELSRIGYPPRDLLFRPKFLSQANAQLNEFQDWLATFPELAVVAGTVSTVPSTHLAARGLANVAVFLQGKRREIRAKTLIPDYDVFTELRYFDSAALLPDEFRAPIEYKGKKLGLLICEDSWESQKIGQRRLYTESPSARLKEKGAELLINISASPFEHEKRKNRRATIQEAAKLHGIPIAYVNYFGAQDEILFDGDAFLAGANGEFLAQKTEINGDTLLANPEADKKLSTEQSEIQNLHSALVMGIRDYARKNGFSRLVLGLSGGIDSAVVACLGAEAVGAANVIGLSMPSKFSSVHSVEDAEALAKKLGVLFRHFPIKMIHSTSLMALKPFFEGHPEDSTEENLQARIRGNAVMAFANKFQALPLATGNKSEFAMGYSTLYGDMCGALAPIGDLYKTEVYALARHLNTVRERIPESTLTKPPSAELRPNQTDQDTLPPYDLLDAVLYQLIEKELSAGEAIEMLKLKFPQATPALGEKILKALRVNEFKRKQAPPILRVSSKAFGSGRAYPITCWYS